MYKSEFDQHLNTNFSFKSIFLYGQSNFFIDYYKDLVIAKISQDPKIKIIYFEEYDYQICKNFLNQPSLFGGENILVIKTSNSIPKKEIDLLINTTINQNSYLILQHYPSQSSSLGYQKDKKAIDSFVKSFTKNNNGCYVRFFNPSLKESLDILSNKTKSMEINISPAGIKFLYESLQENIDFASKELEKLSLLEKDITNEDIKNTISNLTFNETESIFINILDKKPFLTDMQRLIEHKMKDTELIRAFCDFIHNLVLFNIFIKENGFFDSKAIIGVKLPRHIEEKRAKLSIKFKLYKYVEILLFMQKIELDIKTNTYIDKKIFLYSSFSKMQKKL